MLYQQIARNKRKTVVVMAGFIFLVGFFGALMGYAFMGSAKLGVIIALVVGLVYMAIMLGQSTDVVMSMNNAVEITEQQAPTLYHVVEEMAMVANVPMPRVFVIDDPSPNAFATGPNPEHAAVAATTGILERLNREELTGVMAHEMAHVRNYDIRLQTYAMALAAVISFLANWGQNALWWGGYRRDRDDERDNGSLQLIAMVLAIVAIILGPIAASMAQMALSRNREYLADATAVEFTRNPQGLIGALEKITASEPMTQADPSSASMYFANPFRGMSWQSLFDSHPATDKRIARLRAM